MYLLQLADGYNARRGLQQTQLLAANSCRGHFPNDASRTLASSPERRCLPSMYKPNFCAECGERVARERWRLWTSRRFCSGCDVRFRRRRIFAPLALIAALLSAGFIAGRTARPASPPLLVERGELSLAPSQKEFVPARKADAATTQEVTKGEDSSRPASTTPAPSFGPDGTASERPTDPNEIISICGARTKKGTPCQRRVRGTGRCWQHRGLPAMLPASKLIVPN